MLKLNKVSHPLCKIEGGKYNGLVVSVSDGGGHDKNAEPHSLLREFQQLRITNDSKFQHVPDTTKEREILYITGPSGSGKSTCARKYLEQYKTKHKGRPIYLFSSLSSDESLDKIKPKRIKMDESMRQDPLKIDELADSVCIFDDIDVIADKKIRDAVYNILSQALEIGRHFQATLVVTNHLPTSGKDTRRVLNEARAVAYFPRSAGGRIRYLLESYAGLDKAQLKSLNKQNARWVTLYKNYPGVYMAEHEMSLLHLDEIDDDQEEQQSREEIAA